MNGSRFEFSNPDYFLIWNIIVLGRKNTYLKTFMISHQDYLLLSSRNTSY